jgi:thiopurine S-methyltransferase
MVKIKLDKAYWDSRYQSDNIGWDIGFVSPAIKNWFDIQENKDLHILIPGAGSGYEVSYAHKIGFKNVFYMDISSEAVALFKSKNKSFPENRILSSDFFDLNLSSHFDIIIEQTFFCAQSPSRRVKYVKKTHDLLRKKGQIVGLLFGINFQKNGPPFGGDIVQYQKLFESKYEIEKLQICKNSIPERAGNEIWMELTKKN